MAWEPKRVRLLCMLSLTFGFFIVEVVVSRITSSLAMLSDSFHMLSDVIALAVALVAVRFAEITKSTAKNTFGWVRAEVMGALVNAVFLTALCFTILLEAVERYTVPHEIENPRAVIWVGAAGLLVNLLGLFLFHEHAGHGHSHSHSHSHSHGAKKSKAEKSNKTGRGDGTPEDLSCNLVMNIGKEKKSAQVRCNDEVAVQLNGEVHVEEVDVEASHGGSQLNMHGVFLHVLGDALGSVIVVVNALIFTYVWRPCPSTGPCHNPCFTQHCPHQHHHPPSNGTSSSSEEAAAVPTAGPCWVLYLDPTLCVVMVCILLYTTYPLLRESALILLQTVPKSVDVQRLRIRLRSLEGVLAVHELHVWQLAGSRIIATAHIKCHDPDAYMEVAKRVKGMFHDEGIHATTIQPEFGGSSVLGLDVGGSAATLCELPCQVQCAPKQCCGGTGALAIVPAAATASRRSRQQEPQRRGQYQSHSGTAVTYTEDQGAEVRLQKDDSESSV
ncbi:proton-coupled zinc antiporter SLC30A1-like [Engraulis encrasicolus]|uniref:proton-coupled zinc antiporter SLC30A1-like n=1 Tax=Engraulis encrasicolus TaxID=184585 RepID=UPI002FD3B1FD